MKISEMETSHINNALAQFKRLGYVSKAEFWDCVRFAGSIGGEMAQEAASEAIAEMKVNPAIDVLEAELARRAKETPTWTSSPP